MQNHAQIIARCRKKDKKAQKKLYNTYAPLFLGMCMRYSRDRSEAEDILQEAFVKIFLNIERFDNKGSFEGWMKRIVVNTAITFYNQNQKHYHYQEIEQISTYDNNDVFGTEYTQEELLYVINQLPDGYRIVFNLFAIEGYMHKEIAEMLSIDVNTSKSQFSRAKKLIREKLKLLSKEKKPKLSLVLFFSMSENKIDIEGLFKDSFQDYRIEPSPNVWQRVEKTLFINKLGNLFRKPSGFLNIYSISAIIVGSVSFWLFWSAETKENILLSDANYKKSELFQKDENLNRAKNISQEDVLYLADFKRVINNSKKLEKSESTTYAQFSASENSSNHIKTNRNTINSFVAKDLKETKSSEQISVSKNIKKWHKDNLKQNNQLVENKIIKKDLSNYLNGKSYKNNSAFSQIKNTYQFSNTSPEVKMKNLFFEKHFNSITENSNNKKTEKDKFIAFPNQKSSLGNGLFRANFFKLKGSKIELNKIVFDTIVIHDTLHHFDTVRTYLDIPKIENPIRWSVDLYYSHLFSENIIAAQNSQYDEVIALRKKAESAINGFSIGANLNFQCRNWTAQTGVGYTEFGENFDFIHNTEKINTSSFYKYNSFQVIVIDTVERTYHIQNSDTVWIYKTEERQVDKIDSTLTTRNDTSYIKNSYQNANRYSYLEIPLLFGYELNKERWSCGFKGGIIGGFFIKSTGKTLSIDNGNVVELNDDLPFAKTNFSYYLSASLRYRMNYRLSILFEPYFRQSINSIYKESYNISQKYRIYGLKFAIRFHL